MRSPNIAALALLLGALLPAAAAAQAAPAERGPDTVVFTPKRGAVTFTHAKHGELAECASCHHASKPEKPLESEHQQCSACHSTPAVEPMKTSLRLAFHETTAKDGLCYSCHTKEAASGNGTGKTLPSQCNDCHTREP